ncbi:DUF1150 family protein [Rhodovibrio salinarum]|uniref:DUF1150 domain-containing protein n=1 Tax=Rhodovibrio salinarum TaxID=1087 RepID=A0A934QLQ8_9PROT|nr:DUF1150 family protein [Rhodovibrio salinarum]MBK1698805.1 DUF1150 domain-containing protein [Rhodovibrio salinarum]
MHKHTHQEQVSQQDLASWGLNDLAYVKPAVHEGQDVYAIHAADGTQMALVSDRDVAFAAARQHDLEPVSVH